MKDFSVSDNFIDPAGSLGSEDAIVHGIVIPASFRKYERVSFRMDMDSVGVDYICCAN